MSAAQPQGNGDAEAAFERASTSLRAVVDRACTQADPWPARVAAALAAVLDFAAADPDAASLLTVEAYAHGSAAYAVRQRLVDHLAAQLSAGRGESPAERQLPSLTEEMLLGAIVATITKCLLNEEALSQLPALAPELTELVLLPYLGPAQARSWAGRQP